MLAFGLLGFRIRNKRNFEEDLLNKETSNEYLQLSKRADAEIVQSRVVTHKLVTAPA